MLPLLLAFAVLSRSHDLSLSSQLQVRQHLILKQQSLVAQLSRARLSLLDSSAPPSDPDTLLTVVDETPVDPVFARLIPKAEVSTVRNLTAVEFVSLKPIGSMRDAASGHNLAVLAGFSDGVVEVIDTFGEVLYRYNSGHGDAILHIASSSGSEDMKFLTLSRDKVLRLHSLEMWVVRPNSPPLQPNIFGLQSAKVNISITLDTTTALFTNAMLDPSTMKPVDSNPLFNDESAYPTTAMFYIRGGVRYWVIGDSMGGISLHYNNGTFAKRDNTGKGPVAALDRFGPYAVFAAGNTVGVYSLASMQIQQLCDEQLSAVTDVLIDTSTSNNIVSATFANGDIIVFDTRFLMGDKYVCKTLLRIHSKSPAPLKLASARGGAYTWSQSGQLTYYNLAQVASQGIVESSETQLTPGPSPLLMKSLKAASGSYFLAVCASPSSLQVFESLQPSRASTSSFDFGNIKVIMIGSAVGLVIAYQWCKGGKKTAEPEEEEMQRPIRKPRTGKPEKKVTFREPEEDEDEGEDS